MKKIITLLVLASLSIGIFAQKAHPLRWYPFNKTTLNTNKALYSSGYSKDSTVYFGASVGFDVFIKEKKSGDYSLGAMPGFGYGIKWNPTWNPLKKTASFLSLDIFGEAKLDKEIATDIETPTVAKYFNVRVLPVVGVLDWIRVGYGPLFKIGVNGSKGYTDWLFSISISKTL